MKKLRIILAVILLVSLLAGCTLSKPNASKVTFYYSRREFSFGAENSVIVPEDRDITGHEGEMFYILSLYLMGPLDEDLSSAFPANTRLVRYSASDGHLTVELTSVDDILSDAEFSLACSCLSLTCTELTRYDRVTVISGSRSMTLHPSNLMLVDTPIPIESQMEESK